MVDDNRGSKIVEVFSDRYKKQVDFVSTHLRSKDFDELFAANGESPHFDVIESWIMSSRRWIIFNSLAQAVALLGVRPVTMFGETGIPWLVGTDGLNKISKFFLKVSKPVIKEMKIGFKLLENYVDARYKETVRWLKWCGFTVEEPEPFGALGLPFHRFYMELT